MMTTTTNEGVLNFAGILATTPDQKKLIVVQRRIGSADYGLPCGGIEKGEDSLTAALREFEEETGLSRKTIQSNNLSIILKSDPRNSNSKLGQTFFYQYQGDTSIFPFVGPEGLKINLMDMEDYLDICSYRSHDEYVMRNFGLIKS